MWQGNPVSGGILWRLISPIVRFGTRIAFDSYGVCYEERKVYMYAQKKLSRGILAMPVLLLALYVPAFAAGQSGNAQQQQSQSTMTNLEKMVRRELILLPYYTVFDNLEFKIENGDTVVLSGQVVWPYLKVDAESAVKLVKGVNKVVNKIEVLPPLPFDNRIRRREFYAIYSSVGFERYAIQAIPPIHIIVNNGHVTLEGTVEDEMDKNLAGIAANQVPQVFSVTNNLKVRNK